MNQTALNSSLSAAFAKIIQFIVTPVVELVFALAVLLFVWGAAGLILNKDDAEKRATSERHIMWGVLGMFIMVSCYGIIRLIANTIGVQSPV